MTHSARRFRQPQQQGRIDGLCAVYAALNACKLLHGGGWKLDEKLFRHLCQSIADLFPDIVYDGTGVNGVYRLLDAASAFVADETGRTLTWRAPLMRTKFDRVDRYFGRLRADLEVAPSRAWIIGLNKPWDHWTVVRRVTAREVHFFDSYGMRRYPVSSFTIDKRKAGEGAGQKIMIDQHQSYLVELA